MNQSLVIDYSVLDASEVSIAQEIVELIAINWAVHEMR